MRETWGRSTREAGKVPPHTGDTCRVVVAVEWQHWNLRRVLRVESQWAYCSRKAVANGLCWQHAKEAQ